MRQVPRAALPKGSSQLTLPGLAQADLTLIKALDRIFADIVLRLNAARTKDELYAGVWTPTATGTTNVASSTMGEVMFHRDKDYVFVTGALSVTPSGAGAVELDISLPVPSDFTAATDAAGTVSAGAQGVGYVTAVAATDKARLSFTATGATPASVAFSFGYVIK